MYDTIILGKSLKKLNHKEPPPVHGRPRIIYIDYLSKKKNECGGVKGHKSEGHKSELSNCIHNFVTISEVQELTFHIERCFWCRLTEIRRECSYRNKYGGCYTYNIETLLNGTKYQLMISLTHCSSF